VTVTGVVAQAVAGRAAGAIGGVLVVSGLAVAVVGGVLIGGVLIGVVGDGALGAVVGDGAPAQPPAMARAIRTGSALVPLMATGYSLHVSV